MLELKKLGQDIEILAPFIAQTDGKVCDLSLGVKHVWVDVYEIEYAVVNDTLIMKETADEYKNVFYYPIGKDVEGALKLIEEYAKENFIPLKIGYLDEKLAQDLCKRYKDCSCIYEREWSDYIYDAEKFRTYSGKKFSGQRNHVNKFKKLYPGFKVIEYKDIDKERVISFLKEYKSTTTAGSEYEEEEMRKVFSLLENMDRLNQKGAYIQVDGKIIAFSIGEVVNKTLIVHVEKALKSYEGVYPVMASEFVKLFKDVEFVNREEDCGDMGLRTSKTQYQPIEIRHKCVVEAKTLFDKITSPVCLKTERLTITDLKEKDKEDYKRLYTDNELNKYWGYDYREDLGQEEPTADWFYNFQNQLKTQKEEYSFAVYENEKLVGELVLHNFDFVGGVEMGFRFFNECQGKGFATESASKLKEYVFNHLKAEKLKSRCFKQNIPSAKLQARLGLKQTHEDKTHYYFALDKE